MLRLFFMIYGLSFTNAYTIKVSGNVELGDQLSGIVKDICNNIKAKMVDNQNNRPISADSLENPEVVPGDPPHEGDYDSCDSAGYHKSNHVHVHKTRSEPKETPLLDKMMKNDLQKMHLYGLHRFDEAGNIGAPLNNVNF